MSTTIPAELPAADPAGKFSRALMYQSLRHLGTIFKSVFPLEGAFLPRKNAANAI